MEKNMISHKLLPVAHRPLNTILNQPFNNHEQEAKALAVPEINLPIDHILFLSFKKSLALERSHIFLFQYIKKLETLSKVSYTMRPKTEDVIMKNISYLKNPGPDTYQ